MAVREREDVNMTVWGSRGRSRSSGARLVLVLVLSLAWGLAMPGASRATTPEDMVDEPRVALVIGNGDYDFSSLDNPVNDARAISEALRAVGFDVTTLTDASYRDMRRAYIEFGRRLQDGGVGLFYYAGHGVQVNGENYLIPVDVVIEAQEHVEAEGVNMRDVLARMGGARNRLNIVILDACRDNPFKSVMRSGGGRGLARANAPTGTYLAYATAPDQVAYDSGGGEHSPFTAALVEALGTPGADLDDVFLDVRRSVLEATDERQVPWVSNSITGQFYFRPDIPDVPGTSGPQVAETTPAKVGKTVGGAGPSSQATTTPTPAPDLTQGPGETMMTSPAAGQALFWASIMNSDNPVLYRNYLDRWPDGTYAPIARQRLAELDADSEAPPGTAAEGLSRSAGGERTQASSNVATLTPVPLGADGSDDPDALDPLGRTALMIAARDNDQARIRRLLDAGARVDIVGADGNTALTLAAWEGHIDCARLLFDAGADPLAEGPAGPAWEGLARLPAGEALLSEIVRAEPEIGETILDPTREDWRDTQARLNAQGHGAGAVDGQPGPRTRAALGAFQDSQSLPATGYLDGATLARLRAVQPAVAIPRSSSSGQRSNGETVSVQVACAQVEAVLGGSGADIPNPYVLPLPEPMTIDQVRVSAHDKIGFLTNAVLHVYLDDTFVGQKDVKAAGSTLTYAVGRPGRTLKLYSRADNALTSDEETHIHTIRVFARRPAGTPDVPCR